MIPGTHHTVRWSRFVALLTICALGVSGCTGSQDRTTAETTAVEESSAEESAPPTERQSSDGGEDAELSPSAVMNEEFNDPVLFPVQFVGEPLPEWTPGEQPVDLAGVPAPVVSGRDLNGAEVTLGRPGQAQVINVVAHWCGHCQAEIPEVKEWAAAIPEIAVYAISTRQDPLAANWPPSAWFSEAEFPGQVLVDPEDRAGEAYGLGGTPMWLFLDADGLVVARLSGRINQETFVAASQIAVGSHEINADGEVVPVGS